MVMDTYDTHVIICLALQELLLAAARLEAKERGGMATQPLIEVLRKASTTQPTMAAAAPEALALKGITTAKS